MRPVTRFNPTVNGPLHLGHLFLALVNATEAHRSGGEFIVRWDDNQRDWLELLGQAAIDRFRQQMVLDLSTYIQVDRWTSQAEAGVHFDPSLPIPFTILEQPHYSLPIYENTAEFVPDRGMNLYPYAPAYTAERVYLDRVEGVSWLIRGLDLLPEFAFYEFIREMAGFPAVRHTYLPRLRAGSGGQLSPVSKSGGGFTIRDYTAELGPEGVLDLLRVSCLLDPAGEFTVENVKSDPRLVV